MKINKYKYILWDYNGTIVDDLQYSIDIMNAMLSERNISLLNKSTYRHHFDFPVQNYYKAIGFDFTKETFEIVGQEFINRYDANAASLKLMPGIYECLSKLKNAGIKQYILTARKQESMQCELKHFGIDIFFEAAAGLTDDYAAGKTQRCFQLIEEQNINASDSLLIGDTTHDSEVAQSIGSDCILLANGHHPTEKLKQCERPIFSNIAEFMNSYA